CRRKRLVRRGLQHLGALRRGRVPPKRLSRARPYVGVKLARRRWTLVVGVVSAHFSDVVDFRGLLRSCALVGRRFGSPYQAYISCGLAGLHCC
ncbi:unnamed protein product, partial [Symbiodinium pilosum]